MSEEWQRQAWELVNAAVKRLGTNEGQPVREYLEKRGLRPETWQAFSLGAGYCDMPTSKRRGLAVVMPWLSGNRICNVKFRFVSPADERDRFNSKRGGEVILFGLQNVTLGETLILVEGEFNAMSLWQA